MFFKPLKFHVCCDLQVRGSSGGENIIRQPAQNKKELLEEVEEDSDQGGICANSIPHSPNNHHGHAAASRPKTADSSALNSRIRPTTACDTRARRSERTATNTDMSNFDGSEHDNMPAERARTRSASIKNSSLGTTKGVPQAKASDESRHISEGPSRAMSSKTQIDTGSYKRSDIERRHEEGRALHGAAAGAHGSENQHPQVNSCLSVFGLQHSRVPCIM